MTAPACVPAALEPSLADLEARLAGLHQALLRRDPAAIERQADELRRALAQALGSVAATARAGGAPHELRQRLLQASAQVAGQRQALARAGAALDRAMDTLLPPAGRGPSLYSSGGVPEVRSSGPGLNA